MRFPDPANAGLLWPPARVSQSAAPYSGVDYDVVLLVGQSNMVGLGVPVDLGGLDAPDARIWQLEGHTNAVIQAQDPLAHEPVPTGLEGVGLGMTFAKALLATLPAGRDVLLVPAAWGATSFSAGTWAPGGDQRERCKVRANIAMGRGRAQNRLRAILWHQGESDQYAGMSQATYESSIDGLIADLRASISGAANAPFVVGDLLPAFSAPGIKAALQDTPNRVANCAWVDATGSTATDLNDGVHFDDTSLRTMGTRYFTAWQGLDS